jgi:hypothetical protein
MPETFAPFRKESSHPLDLISDRGSGLTASAIFAEHFIEEAAYFI